MNNYVIDGQILTKVFENSKFGQNQKNANLENAIRIYNKIPNSKNSFSSNVGLVVGKIQSGKTANIITLSGLALDNDTKLIIMLLSDTTNLLDQNYGRIYKSFDDCKDVLVFKEAEDGDFKGIDSESLNKLYNRGKRIIICSLKHYEHINTIASKLKGTGYATDYTMIIDDEGDDISQNTAKEKYAISEDGKTFENDRSTNNNSIYELKKVLDNCGYISLTATPEAPIFLQSFQELSPNYCITLQPGIGYTGLTTFHQSDSEYVEVINDYDCLVKDSGVPDSLINSVAFFFAGCIYRKNKNFKDDLHSMMIHPAKEIFKHDNVYSKLKMRLKLLEKSLLRDESSGLDFLDLVAEQYKKISKELYRVQKDELLYVFNNYKISNINGREPERDINRIVKIFPYNIFIGGDLLDRGITIPNLAVSYIIRDSKKGQVDTLLQRARWFGYKKDYLMTCRVYMPGSLAEKYTEILETEDSLWDFLEECSEMDYDLKNCEFSLDINSSILNPTSSSKASYEFGYSNITSVKQQKNFTINNEQNNSNILLVRNFNWNNSYKLEYNKVQTHRCLNLNINEINSFIDNYNFSEYNVQKDSLDKQLLKKYISENIEKYGNTVTLIDMRYDSYEERSVYNDNCIRNLMQGRSEGKDKNDFDYYPGDRYLPEMKNKISLQIHHVKLKIKDSQYYQYGDEVIMLVLCMPKDFVIKNFVSRKNIADIDRIYV